MTHAQLAEQLLAHLDAETRDRILGALNAGAAVNAVALEFGVSPKLLRRLAPKRKHGVEEASGIILDPIAAAIPAKHRERDTAKTAPLTDFGQAEYQRRADQALRVDALLRSLGLAPVARSTPIVIQPTRPDRVLSDLRQARGGCAPAPRRRESRLLIPDLDHPPWPDR